ncbi:armadillo repeat-containing protein 8-like isoform X2 [Planococcus citri]|uniref:armadillo repeat-containing protein 8-like isoform X2 n=1 Tax=Planococcus citri TaxID=170843 RepID=UPI0031F752A4
MAMLIQNYPLMDVESSRSFMDDIYSSEHPKCLSALIQLKNTVIGSNRQKGNAIQQGVIPRLVQILGDYEQPVDIRNETVIILGSLAKGTEDHVKELLKADVVPLLLNCILTDDNQFSENCLRCVCSIFKYNCAPVHLIFQDQSLISHMLSLIMHSTANQISITTILSYSIKTKKHQTMLWDEGAVFSLAALLRSPLQAVLMPTLTCIASLCHENKPVAASVATANFEGKSVPDLLVALMARDKPLEMQLAVAKCITFLYRAGAISAEDPKILYKTLPVLVYLCQDKYAWKLRVETAETLAYLTEVNVELQRLAAISNHLIGVLNTFVNYKSDSSLPPAKNEEIRKELMQAAFRVFASLGSNDEDIRKKIIESENLVQHIVNALDDPSTKVKLAAIRCLHSLSRSVQQLRTTFHDHSVWKPLMRLLENASDDVLTVTSSTLCNLLLEFSPSKEPILESGAVDLLCNLTRRSDPALRLNGIWALMNMAFQAEQKIKTLILNTLGIEHIFRLLNDSEVNVLMKTLGLLRNLLCTKPHIDYIMNLHGNEIIQAVTMILDANHPSEVKEQALCILANIADGDSAKDFIMNNEDILKKLSEYMISPNGKLQVASTFCISNLVWKEESGSTERQTKLRELGIPALLNRLMNTTNTLLFDKNEFFVRRVKTAVTQFSDQ